MRRQDGFKLMIQRPDNAAGVFSGDFSGPGQALAAGAKKAVASLHQSFRGTLVPLEVFNVNHTTLSPAALCKYLKALNPDVTTCEVDFKVKVEAPSAQPNDPLYPKQWNMAAIKAPGAWGAGQLGGTLGGPQGQVRVCMVDTGTDVTHPDLQPNLWMNHAEMNGPGANAANGYCNGIDDDGNGIIDDIYGANFVNGGKDGNVQDQNGHGSFVAGVVGAVGNNGLGVTGINQLSSIVTCRFMDSTGNGWVSDAIRCFEYCLSKDAHVMSNSWGGVDYSQSLQTAIDHVAARGSLIVASAGNDGVNTDTTAHYPSSLPDAVIMAVAASTNTNQVWSRSNYGSKTVHIAAPGVQVLSTGLGGLYITLSGTSMATPHVAGTAALMLAQYVQNGFNISTKAPNKGYGQDLKRIMMASATAIPGAQLVSGLLNAQAALALVPVNSAGKQSAVGAFSSGFGNSSNVGRVENSPAVGPGGSPPESVGLLPWNVPGPRQDSVATIEGRPPPPPGAASPPPPSPIADAIAHSPIGEAVQRVPKKRGRLRNPRWVLERISKERSGGDAQRKNVEFYEDAGLEPRFRSRLTDFRGSGYDRGHLAPAANYKGSQDAMTNTFVLSNISPQVGKGFNRDYWARFERFIKQLTHTCDDVYVLTGPLYLPQRTPQGYMMQHPMIGVAPRLVAVPTHFFKAVLAEKRGAGGVERALVGAWVLPNAPIEQDTPLMAFTVPIDALEDAAGMPLFPKFLDDERRGALDEAALEVQGAGRRELQALRGRGAALPPPLLEQPPQPPLLLPLPDPISADLTAAAAAAAAEAGQRGALAP
ncbi:hypothetical protein WJX81_006169 [Elliptochloris bilobata]|uniref:Endonuclease n=1 Tax=Elliptochloris bilobata TaxID=381761 RepID=A0AAW1QI53_9CHLO